MPVITISRQFGAGGKTLGEMISKELGYTFVDDEIVYQVAKMGKISTDWVKSIEKCAGCKLLGYIDSLVSRSFVERILDDKRGYIDEEVYVELLHNILNKVAEEGNAVILGRGGQYILRDHIDTIHVLLIADKHDRIKFLEERYALSLSKAVQTINREDKRRSNLYRKFGKEDYDQPGLYHLVLNTSHLDLDTAARLVCSLVA